MNKHTPLPWSIRNWEKPNGGCTIENIELDAYIADVYAQHHDDDIVDVAQGEANARLIATAPELLEAAEAVLDDAFHLGSDGFGDCKECGADMLNEPVKHTTCALGKLQAAITKAKGDEA